MALKQHLAQKLEQRLSPQQIQLMKLLQVPTMELDQRIKQEIEENPALEEGADVNEEEYDNDDDFDDDYDSDSDDQDFDISDYIDEEGSDYKTKANNHSKDDEERVIPLSGEQSFQEKLTEQLHLLYLDDHQFTIALLIFLEMIVHQTKELRVLHRPYYDYLLWFYNQNPLRLCSPKCQKLDHHYLNRSHHQNRHHYRIPLRLHQHLLPAQDFLLFPV